MSLFRCCATRPPLQQVNTDAFVTNVCFCVWFQHLQEVETRILETMAWQTGSPLYEVLNRTDSVRLHLSTPSPRGAHGSPVLEHSSAAQL